MRIFEIPRDPLDMGCNIYQKKEITINPGVTVLVGCNGIGKTTLLRLLKEQLRNENIPVISYNNLWDGGDHSRGVALRQGNLSFLAESALSSEGENITLNIGNFAAKIGAFQRQHAGVSELWLLFDAVDSGLSVDNIVELKEDLFSLILQHRGDTEIYIIISANEYELARGEACFDVLRGKYITFKTYEAYRNFILKTREAKNKRVCKPVGRGKRIRT